MSSRPKHHCLVKTAIERPVPNPKPLTIIGGLQPGRMRLTTATHGGIDPTIATNGEDVIHIAWSDSRDGGNPEIYYKRSTDGGATFGADTRLTTTDSSRVVTGVYLIQLIAGNSAATEKIILIK